MRFFAHSISPASSLRGMNLCGGGSALASDAISGAFESSISGSGSPVCRVPEPAQLRERRGVERSGLDALTPSAASRSFSSPAAFSVKVTARICSAGNVPVAT